MAGSGRGFVRARAPVTAPGAAILHDPAALLRADVAGLLPAVAGGGAQVRATAEQLEELGPAERPRSLVVIGPRAPVDVAILSALIGERSPAPVLSVPSVPTWVGPLDAVVVLAGTPDDAAAAQAADIARRRGARCIVRGSDDGPVAAAAGPDLLAPRVPVSEALAAPGRITLLVGIAAALGLCPRPDLRAAADLIDQVALACRPGIEAFVNPAVTLAEQLAGGTPLIIGTDPVGDALARHAVRVLADVGGYAAASLPAAQAASSPAVLARAATTQDLFADPYDEPTPGQEVRAVVVSGSAAGPQGRRLVSALHRAMPRLAQVTPDDLVDRGTDSPSSYERGLEPGGDPTRATPGGPRGGGDTGPAEALALITRLDFAAVYLGLTAGAIVPLDSPDGLGPRGAARAVGAAVFTERPRDADGFDGEEPDLWS